MTSESWQAALGLRQWAEQLRFLEPVAPARVFEGTEALLAVAADSHPVAAYAYNAGGSPSAEKPDEPEVPLSGSDQDQLAKLLKRCGVQTIGADSSTGTVIIYTRKRPTRAELNDLPGRFDDGSRLALRPLRPFSVGPAVPVAGNAAATVAPNGRYTCGSSIGMGTVRDAGTLGALVEDATNLLFGLSCCHVIGGCGQLPPETPILAPGIRDIESRAVDPFTIGRYTRALAMTAGEPAEIDPTQNADAALFKVTRPDTVTSWQRGAYDTPTETQAPVSGLAIEKVGRTTGPTAGTLGARLAYPVAIAYNNVVFTGPNDAKGRQVKQKVYYDPVFLVESDPSQPFSLPGDSGALVTAIIDGFRYAIGMVVGGDNKSISLVVPIASILTNLGVRLVRTGG